MVEHAENLASMNPIVRVQQKDACVTVYVDFLALIQVSSFELIITAIPVH